MPKLSLRDLFAVVTPRKANTAATRRSVLLWAAIGATVPTALLTWRWWSLPWPHGVLAVVFFALAGAGIGALVEWQIDG